MVTLLILTVHIVKNETPKAFLALTIKKNSFKGMFLNYS